MKKKKFVKQKRDEIDTRIREAKDGCLHCRELGSLCRDHAKVLTEIIVNPRSMKRLAPFGLVFVDENEDEQVGE